MSLLDVFSGRQSLGSWLTGRDPKEADVYANYSKVSETSESIRSISKNQLTTAQESIYAAFEQLNSVHGLAEHVGTIEVANYDTVFDSIATTMEEIASQLEGKAADIKTYEESSIFQKIGSTAFMGICKVGEGLLSVVEDLGDGVLSVVGWGAGVLGATNLQNSISNTIKSEWSHDIFNGYYQSDFAKMSFITEDSALAGACKIAGKTVGYLYAGGAIAGMTGLSGATNVGVGVLKASGSTWGATIAGATGGLGAGTETGLNSGMTYNQAMGLGLLTGTIQGGLAFAGGKLGEKLAKNAKIKSDTQAANQATDAMNSAKSSMDSAKTAFDEANNKLNQLWDAGANDKAIAAQEAIVKNAETSLKTATDAFNAAKSAADTATKTLAATTKSSLASYQGYTDSVTQAGERFGTAVHDTVGNGINALRSTASASNAIRKGTIDASAKSAEASAAQDSFRDSLRNLAHENPVSQGARTIRDSVTNAAANVQANGVTGAIGNGVNGVRNAATAAANSVRTNGIIGAAKNAVTSMSPATPGVIAAAAGSTINESMQSVGRENAQTIKTVGPIAEKAEHGDDLFKDAFKPADGTQTSPPPGTTAPPGSVSTTAPPGTTAPPQGTNPPGGGYNPPGGGYNPPGGSDGTQPPTQPTQPPTEPTQPPTQPPTEPTQPPTQPVETVPPTQPVETVPPTQPGEPVPPTQPSGPGYTVTPGADPGGSSTYIVEPGDDGTHSGVGYDGETMTSDSLELENAENLDILDLDMDDDTTSSLDDIVGGSQYTKIPTSNKPVTTTNKRSSSSVIPIAAGLSVAAAAGIGAKAYMDRKRNNDVDDDEEYEDDDFDSEEWTGDEDTIEVDYSDGTSTRDGEDYLEEDNYYQDDSGYTARSSNELADLQ